MELQCSVVGKGSRVKVYMARTDEKLGFFHATCFLPNYDRDDVSGFSEAEIKRLQDVICSAASLIILQEEY